MVFELTWAIRGEIMLVVAQSTTKYRFCGKSCETMSWKTYFKSRLEQRDSRPLNTYFTLRPWSIVFSPITYLQLLAKVFQLLTGISHGPLNFLFLKISIFYTIILYKFLHNFISLRCECGINVHVKTNSPEIWKVSRARQTHQYTRRTLDRTIWKKQAHVLVPDSGNVSRPLNIYISSFHAARKDESSSFRAISRDMLQIACLRVFASSEIRLKPATVYGQSFGPFIRMPVRTLARFSRQDACTHAAYGTGLMKRARTCTRILWNLVTGEVVD